LSTRTLYPVIDEPPSLTGAVHDTTAWAFPGTADTAVGGFGAVNEDGVTAALGNEPSEFPDTLAAVTENVYAVPFVRPETVAVVAIMVLTDAPPGDAVTVYPVTADPPLLAGAIHDTAT